MCDPISAGVALMAVGTTVNAYSNMKKANAQNEASAYNAETMEMNAQFAEQDAQWVEQAGAADEKKLARVVEQMKSTQRAAYGSTGVVVDSGSALDVIQDTASKGAIDALTMERNTARKARSLRQQGLFYRRDAQLSKMMYQSPSEAFFTTLLTGGSQLGGTYLLTRRG